MPGLNSREHPIPLLSTAEAVVRSDDDRIQSFFNSLFEGITPDQIENIRIFLVDVFLEGIEMGGLLERHGATDDLPHDPDAVAPSQTEPFLNPLEQVDHELDVLLGADFSQLTSRHLANVVTDYCTERSRWPV